MPKLEVQYKEARGYHLTLPLADMDSLPTDGSCCQVVQHKRRVACTTPDMLSLNARNRVRTVSLAESRESVNADSRW